jgi:hypothetical protein
MAVAMQDENVDKLYQLQYVKTRATTNLIKPYVDSFNAFKDVSDAFMNEICLKTD